MEPVWIFDDRYQPKPVTGTGSISGMYPKFFQSVDEAQNFTSITSSEYSRCN
jgi:hypothetical protein